MNYAQLEEFIKTLTPEQKQEHVVIQVLDETSVRLKEVMVNDVDYFYNEDSDGLLPVEDYDPEHWCGKLLTDTDYNTIVPAGSRVFAYDDSFAGDNVLGHNIQPYQIVVAMKKNGWKVDFQNGRKVKFEKDGLKIQVQDSQPIDKLFKDLMKAGETFKMWEIQRMLGIHG